MLLSLTKTLTFTKNILHEVSAVISPFHQPVTRMRSQQLKKTTINRSIHDGQDQVPPYIFISFEKLFCSVIHHNRKETTITISIFLPTLRSPNGILTFESKASIVFIDIDIYI